VIDAMALTLLLLLVPCVVMALLMLRGRHDAHR
jgi:hypothetical protein